MSALRCPRRRPTALPEGRHPAMAPECEESVARAMAASYRTSTNGVQPVASKPSLSWMVIEYGALAARRARPAALVALRLATPAKESPAAA